MNFHSFSGASILEFLLIISCWSLGTSQPHNYHHSHSSNTGTAHIRAPHARGTRASTQTDHQHQHYVPHKPSGGSAGDYQAKLLHDKQLLHDKEHLKEDMGDWLFKDGKEMTEEEMEFHYFKSHDFDNNSKLDGLEILQAISHILPMTEVETDLTPGGGNSPSSSSHNHDVKRAEMMKQREEDFAYYVDLIDKVLDEDDLNNDGYLSYLEYAIGRKREEERENQAKSGIQTSKTHRY